jgi:hypothetical protein
MKIRVYKIFSLLIFVILLANESFFDYASQIPGLSVYCSETNKTLVTGLTLITLFLFLMLNKETQRMVYNTSKHLNQYVFLFLMMVTVVFIASAILYRNEELAAMINNVVHYYSILLYIPILYIFYNDEEEIFRILEAIYVIWLVLIIAQVIMINTSGAVFLNIFYNRLGNVEYRNGNVRLYGGMCFFNLMALVNFYKFEVAEKIKSKFAFLVLFIGGFYVAVMVEQTRAMVIAIIVTLLGTIILRQRNLRTFVTGILLVVLVVAWLVSSQYIDYLISSSTTGIDSYSSFNRMKAIGYYLHRLLYNPFFGFGFTNNVSIVHSGGANIDDTGIFGQMARMGIWPLMFMIACIVRLGKIAYTLKKKNMVEADLVNIFFFYIITTSLTFIIWDPQRMLAFPFILAISEFYYARACDNEAYQYY